MDTTYLTKLVMDKFMKSEGYSEMPIEKLTESIISYLDQYYLDQVKMSILQIQVNDALGKEATEVDYKESYQIAKEQTIKQAYAVGAIDQKDLDDLKEMSKL